MTYPKQFDGSTIDALCDLVEQIQPEAHEQAGMSREQYRQAESLYLHGDLSGIER